MPQGDDLDKFVSELEQRLGQQREERRHNRRQRLRTDLLSVIHGSCDMTTANRIADIVRRIDQGLYDSE